MIQGIALSVITALILLAISITDTRTHRIPNILVTMLLAVGIASVWLWPEIQMETRIAGIFIVSAPLFLIASLFPGSFGGGDAKLMAAAGFLLGWPGALISFVIAAFTCGVYSVLSLVLGKKSRSDAFAFGPHLCVGIFLGMLYVV